MSTHRPTSPEAVLAQEDFVRALARQLLRDAGAADDVTQDTLVTALDRGPDNASKLRGWMAAVARNGARRTQRAESRRRQREFETARPESDVPSPEEIADREAARRRVVQAVLALDPEHRDALVLRYWEGLDAKAMGARLDLSLEGARTRLKRAHARLRAELMQREGPDWRQAIAPVALGGAGLGAGGSLLAVGWKVAAAALVGLGAGTALIPGATSSASPGGTAGGQEVAVVSDDEERDRGLAQGLLGAEPMGASERREVPVAPAETTHHMRVRVVRDDGEPLSGAEVWFENLEREPTTITAASSETFVVEDHDESPAEPVYSDVEVEEGAPPDRIPLAAMGYALELEEESAEPLATVGARTDEDGWVWLEFEEETEGTVYLMDAGSGNLSTRHLRRTSIETGSGSHVITVPRMTTAQVTLEVRALHGGQLLGDYQVDVWGRPDQALVEAAFAEEGRVSFTVPVHPTVNGEQTTTRVMLEVQADGIVPIARYLNLAPGEERKMSLRHVWEQRVTGVVLDPEGSPVEGALVLAGDANHFRHGAAYLPYAWEDEDGVQTDERGRFELLTGDHLVCAHHPDHGVATVEAAGTVELRLTGTATVFGQLTRSARGSVAGSSVTLDDFHRAKTDGEGRFRFSGLEPGVHHLAIGGYRVRFELEVGEELELNLGEDFVDTTVTIPGHGGRVSIYGEAEVCSILSRGMDDEHRLVLPNALSGPYWLITPGELMQRIDLTAGSQTVHVPSGQILLTAMTDELFWLVPADASAHLEWLVRCHEGRLVPPSGEVTFRGVAPGEYDLVRFDGRRDRVSVGTGDVEVDLKE